MKPAEDGLAGMHSNFGKLFMARRSKLVTRNFWAPNKFLVSPCISLGISTFDLSYSGYANVADFGSGTFYMTTCSHGNPYPIYYFSINIGGNSDFPWFFVVPEDRTGWPTFADTNCGGVLPSPTPSPPQFHLVLSSDSFSPDGDTINDDLLLTPTGLLEGDAWTLSVDGTGVIGSGTGSTSLSWDSTVNRETSDEILLPDGLYSVRLSVAGKGSVTEDVFIEHDLSEVGDDVAGLKEYVSIAMIAYAAAKIAVRAARVAWQEAKAAWKAKQISDAAYAAAQKALKDAEAKRLESLRVLREQSRAYRNERNNVHQYLKKPDPQEINNINESTGLSLQAVKARTPLQGGGGFRARWKDRFGNIWEWDQLHGEFEKYNALGKHMGVYTKALKPKSGAVPGRTIAAYL